MPGKPIKVLHINTTDTSGSAIAARRISDAVRKKKVDSVMLVLDKLFLSEPYVTGYFDSYKGKAYKLKALLQRNLLPSYYQWKTKPALPEGEMFTFPKSLIDVTKHPLYSTADIIHLHFISDFVDIPSFFRKNNKPVVWTLHDMNPFSGGYHIKENNMKIHPGIQKLKQLNLSIKRAAYDLTSKMIITAPSKWLIEEVEKSKVFSKFNHVLLPNLIDLNHYKPYPQKISRDILKIPATHIKIILFIADDHNAPNKGKEAFLWIYEKLMSKFLFIVAGKGSDSEDYNQPEIHRLGYISSELLLPLVYSAADVTLVPSGIESFSLVTLESLACGVPVAAYNTTGPAEIIEHKKSGYLADVDDKGSLIDGIELILDDTESRKMKINAELRAKEFDSEIISGKFIELYRNLLIGS